MLIGRIEIMVSMQKEPNPTQNSVGTELQHSLNLTDVIEVWLLEGKGALFEHF